MALAEDQDAVGELGPGGGDEAFGEAVRPRAESRRRADRVIALGCASCLAPRRSQNVVCQVLMRKVRADTYPSMTDLDLIETVIPHHMLDEYVEILIDKVDDDRFPSICLLRRINRIIECLPQRDHEADDEP